MENEEFINLANEKGQIVSNIKHTAEPIGWAWMMVDEGPEKMVIELRKVGFRF